MLAPRLIEAGPTPQQSEELISRLPTWEDAPRTAVAGARGAVDHVPRIQIAVRAGRRPKAQGSSCERGPRLDGLPDRLTTDVDHGPPGVHARGTVSYPGTPSRISSRSATFHGRASLAAADEVFCQIVQVDDGTADVGAGGTGQGEMGRFDPDVDLVAGSDGDADH
jgi:hypothetical protein